MSGPGEMKPKPLGLKRKPRGVSIEDLQPADTLTDLKTSTCSGRVYGQGVLVTQLQDIWTLVKLGCYGKGIFSRSIPSHQHIPSRNQIPRKRKAADVDGEEIETRWKKRMKLHSQWRKEVQGATNITAEGGAEKDGEQGIAEETVIEGEGKKITEGGQEGRTNTEEKGKMVIECKGMTGDSESTIFAEEEGRTNIAKGDNEIVKEEEFSMAEGIAETITESIVKEESTTSTREGESKKISHGTGMIGEREGMVGGEICVPVLDETSADDDYQKLVSRLSTIKQDDPYQIDEYLQLGAEEAFYLSAEAGVLTVESDEAGILSGSDLWHHFVRLNKSFCARYVAYSHYRDGDWVPKSGLKFGVDFLLYKESPLSYHSSFAVVIREEDGGSKHCNLSWKEVIALGRVSESAKKDLLLCQVTWPKGVTKGEQCRATITDILVKRWVPERDR